MKVLLKLLNLIRFIFILIVCIVLLITCIGTGIIMAHKYENQEYPFEQQSRTIQVQTFSSVSTSPNVTNDGFVYVNEAYPKCYPMIQWGQFVSPYYSTQFQLLVPVRQYTASVEYYYEPMFILSFRYFVTSPLSSTATETGSGYCLLTDIDAGSFTLSDVTYTSGGDLYSTYFLQTFPVFAWKSYSGSLISNLDEVLTSGGFMDEDGNRGSVFEWELTQAPEEIEGGANVSYPARLVLQNETDDIWTIEISGSGLTPSYYFVGDQVVRLSASQAAVSYKVGVVDFFNLQNNDLILQHNYETGFGNGYTDGYDDGYTVGMNASLSKLTGWDTIKGAFISIFEALQVKVFGIFSLGDIIGLCLVLTVVMFVLKFARG